MTQMCTLDQTITSEVIEEDTTPEGPLKRHIINPPSNLHIWKPGMSAQDVVDVARVRHLELVALCGERFFPTRNPEDVKETCNVCLDIAGELMRDS